MKDGFGWGRFDGIDRRLWKYGRKRVVAGMVMAGSVVSGWGVPSAEDLEYFEREVRPVLADHCYECHSGAAKKLKAGLYLDSREGVLVGGDSGPAVVPRDPEKSLLIESVRYGNVDLQMPPKSRLSPEAVAALEQWVRMGAPWPEEDGGAVKRKSFDLAGRRAEHWCWHGPAERVVPEVARADWPLGAIDRFVLAKLEEAGLPPAEDADRRTWIRRVAFDLTGLPPAPGEVAAFLADASPEAHAWVVDRLLASPEFGVKWARHWLDLMRYAESYGHEFDYPIPEAWRYRDYLVRALNADVPYNQFVTEHIAGDLLEVPRPDPATGMNESVVATGAWWLGEATHSPTDVRGDEAGRIDNQIDVFSKSFLGLTVSCARCHDHKFDAISTRDYYAMEGYLQSSRRQLAMLDPGGRIAAGAAELRSVQAEASGSLGARGTGAPAEFRPGVIASFDEGMPPGWSTDGEAFPEKPTGFDQPQVVLGDPGRAVARGGVMHSGLYGRRPHGVLRSPTFTLAQPQIHLRLAGTGPVEVRVVIDGYFMQEFNALLFQGTRLEGKALETGGEYAWKTLGGDLRKYVGRTVYLEFLDRGDGFLAVDEVAYDKGTEPKPDPEGGSAAELGVEAFYAKADAIGSAMPSPDYALGMTDGTPEDARVHIRGGHANLGEVAPRRFLTAFGGPAPADAGVASGRLDLARQVVAPENPLTARVQVNRLWHHLTGRGLVATVDDFGVMGEAPSHPELLDWLARDFVDGGWSTKRMIRQIVLSRTYRMSCEAVASPDAIAEKDAANVLMHKFRVRRLASEAVRDGILAVSGRLDAGQGGPSVPVHLTSFMEGRGRPGSGPLDGNGRRSIYTAIKRNFLPPMQLAFDMPVPFTTMGRRSRSNVPAQSLTLMNDPFVIAEAGRWAERLLKVAAEERIPQAFEEAFSRPPVAGELRELAVFLERQQGLYQGGADDRRVWTDLCHVLFNQKEFIYIR